MMPKIKDWIKKITDSCFWRYSVKLKFEQQAKIEIKPFQNLECIFEELEVNKSYTSDNKKWIHKEEVIKIIDPCIIEPVYANIIFNFNHIFKNSVFYSALTPSVPKYIKARLKSDFINLDESIVFDGDVGSNYFHFFSNVLPKLWMLDKYGIDKNIPLLIGEMTFNSTYFQYVYKNTNVSYYNWIVLKKHVKSKTTYILKPLPYNREYLVQTKNILIENLKKKIYSDNVFLNRSVLSGRYIENFPEIKIILDKYDFQVYDTNEMSLADQISLFNAAKKVISIHGAGNTNIIFSEPGLKFLEINPKNRIACQYYWLSSVLNIEYNVILGDNLPYVNSYPEKSFYLDPVKLERYILNWMLK